MWSPASWQQFPIQQHVDYPDLNKLQAVMDTLAQWPPLITPGEIDKLKQRLVSASVGESFLLQGGDCAESFEDCHTENITNKFKILLQMSVILLYGMRKPVIRVGRIAGQYAKPRSSATETQDNQTLPSYRGDLINGGHFSQETRQPDPNRMLDGYRYAAMTLNYIRSLVNGGFANLHTPHQWDLNFVKHAASAQEYHKIVNSISDAISFVETIDGIKESRLNRIDDLFTSHESLHLPYESALTRQIDGKWYNLATHFPWIGMRTAALDSAHIEYFRGIENPIAVKIGPSATTDFISNLVDTLNPNNEAGKLMLITRLGSSKIDALLPDLIKAVQDTGKLVLWSCDPMHGNTRNTQSGGKTRHFDDIVSELTQAMVCHENHGSHLGGVHLELTGDDVTECIGGARGLEEKDLERAFKSLVDPRLNYEQSLEVAFQICRHHKSR